MICPPILLVYTLPSLRMVHLLKRSKQPASLLTPCLWVVIVDPAVFSSKALEAGATIAREVLEMTSAQLKKKNRTLSNYLFNYLSNAWCSKMSRKPRTKGRMSVQVFKKKRTERFKYDQKCICLCDFRKYCDLFAPTLKCGHGV